MTGAEELIATMFRHFKCLALGGGEFLHSSRCMRK